MKHYWPAVQSPHTGFTVEPYQQCTLSWYLLCRTLPSPFETQTTRKTQSPRSLDEVLGQMTACQALLARAVVPCAQPRWPMRACSTR